MVAIGDDKQLDIEAPAFDMHHFEKDLGNFLGHKLEATLRVVDFDVTDIADNEVQHPRKDLAIPLSIQLQILVRA